MINIKKSKSSCYMVHRSSVYSRDWIPIMFLKAQKDMGRDQIFKSNNKHLNLEHMNV